jgi:uncharacterized protein
MPTVNFLILQPTPFCNISCKYCYLPHRSSRERMSPQTIEKIFSGLFASGWVGAELHVVWHGGEPLVLPVGYYEDAFRLIAALAPAGVKIGHGFQTNGMFIDDEWCAFFKRTEAAVGVSIDGPEAAHDENRVTRAGRGTYAETMKGIRCLQRNGVDFNVITVLTAAALAHPREFYEFYVREGIDKVCFNFEEIEGSNRHSSLVGDRAQTDCESFMRQFWNLNRESGRIGSIREFKHMLDRIVRPLGEAEVGNTLVEPFAHLNVDWQGNFSTFSPEFLGHENAYYHDFIIGNFHTGSLEASLQSEAFTRLNADVAAGVELCRRSCEYYAVCGGGSPVNKLYENGSIASAETMYCRLYVKVFADLAMEILENSASLKVGGAIAAAVAGGSEGAADGEEAHPLWRADTVAGTRRVVVFSTEMDLAERIQLSAGRLAPPGAATEAWNYENGAIVPEPCWRDLTSAEAAIVIADASPPETGTGIAVTRLPERLMASFEPLRAAIAAGQGEREIEGLLASAEVREGLGAAERYFRDRFGRPAAEDQAEESASGTAVRHPGLPTVTIDRSTNRLIGLHLDDWYAFPLGRRHRSPNRVCVNLGAEDRFLVFINRPLAQMHRELRDAGHEIRMVAGATPIARAFMRLFPRYPLLRLRIRPGEAYIAPTENIAHDASSVGMSTFDVSLQIRGHFALAARGSVGAEPSDRPTARTSAG